jgi:uncharacterized membrane protein
MAGEPWSVGYFTAMLVMWIIMMVGMMVPSAIPMVLIYASIVRKHPAAPEAKNHVRSNPESAEAAKSNMYDNSPSTDDDRRRAITRRGQPRRQSSFVGPI